MKEQIVSTQQKTYSEINTEQLPLPIAELILALMPFGEMDRPGEIKAEGHGGDDELAIALGRGTSSDQTILTNQDFRNAAKAIYDITGAVPESYWSYGIEFK